MLNRLCPPFGLRFADSLPMVLRTANRVKKGERQGHVYILERKRYD